MTVLYIIHSVVMVGMTLAAALVGAFLYRKGWAAPWILLIVLAWIGLPDADVGVWLSYHGLPNHVLLDVYTPVEMVITISVAQSISAWRVSRIFCRWLLVVGLVLTGLGLWHIRPGTADTLFIYILSFFFFNLLLSGCAVLIGMLSRDYRNSIWRQPGVFGFQ
ncbi:MAG: hypothetical protein QM757_39505 [Paludibaculum sp.]